MNNTYKASRKARFRAALALAEKTAVAWCDENGITVAHLHAVLSGNRESASLTAKVDAFIDAYLPSGNGAAA